METALREGHVPDRCEILQDGHTLVLRLSETLVGRVVNDLGGPRQGGDWFARENAVAIHLAGVGAPVIPVHPDLPPGPHVHLGYPLNFWKFVTVIESEPSPRSIGQTLYQCHEALRSFTGSLSELAILHETRSLLEGGCHFAGPVLDLLMRRIDESVEVLAAFPKQPLHGDAHEGNLLQTDEGLLWTDWEDTFVGPIEWDLASILWNSRYLDGNPDRCGEILDGYRAAGGEWNETALHHCFIARAAVMSAWYPILYPNAGPERQEKLRFRLKWLEDC